MFFYFILLFFIIITCGRFYVLKDKRIIGKYDGYRIALLYIIFFSSFRFNIGYDWNQYLSFVYPTFNIASLPNHELFNRYIYIIAGTIGHPWVLFCLYAILTYTLIGKTIFDFSCDKYASLMIYICLFYLPGLSTIRQEVAVAIVFYAYRFIKGKKIIKYCFCCILASLFHKSAIICVFFYPLFYSKFSIVIIFMFLFSLLYRNILPRVISTFYPHYMSYLSVDLKHFSGNFQKMFYLALLFYVFIINKTNKNIGMINICLVGCMLPYIFGGHTGGRLAEYFLFYYILLLPECNKRVNKTIRILFLFPFYAFFFIYLFVSVYKNHSNEYVPFRWYFLESLEQKLQ